MTIGKHIKERGNEVWVVTGGFLQAATLQLTSEVRVGVKAMRGWCYSRQQASSKERKPVHSPSGWLEHGTFRQQEKPNMAGAQHETESVGQRSWRHGFLSLS